jgi:hypothetical protein
MFSSTDSDGASPLLMRYTSIYCISLIEQYLEGECAGTNLVRAGYTAHQLTQPQTSP